MVTLVHRGLVVRRERKVVWEIEVSRVTWDLQVHKEYEETWARRVNQAEMEIKATVARKERKVLLVLLD